MNFELRGSIVVVDGSCSGGFIRQFVPVKKLGHKKQIRSKLRLKKLGFKKIGKKPMLRIRIRFVLVNRIRIRFNITDPDEEKISLNHGKFPQKSTIRISYIFFKTSKLNVY